MAPRKGGVYAVDHQGLYDENDRGTRTMNKIGHSQDIHHRLSSGGSFSRGSLVSCVTGVVHSPRNAYAGTRILEALTHYYFRDRHVEKEIFAFPLGFRLLDDKNGLLEFLRKRHIQDAEVYKNLDDVPETVINKTILKVHKQQREEQQRASRDGYVYRPRDYQEDIIARTVKHFADHPNGSLFLAPGIGKTYISGFVVQRARFNRVLVLTPRIDISEEFRKMAHRLGMRNVVMCTSQDESIDDVFDTIRSAREIFVVTTYQTYTSKMDLFGPFDFVVYDEAHHLVTAKTFQKTLRTPGRHLFLTATPRTIGTLANGSRVEYSLDNENLYGKVIMQTSVYESIDAGWLCDMRLLVFDSLANAVEFCRVLGEQYGRQHIGFFFSRREDARRARDAVTEALPWVDAYYIDGDMSRAERESIKRDFQRSVTNDATYKTRAILNCNVLEEGVSIPCMDSVVIMDPRSGERAVQTMTRPLRLHGAKTEAIVCVPWQSVDTVGTVLENLWANSTLSSSGSRDGENPIMDRLMVYTESDDPATCAEKIREIHDDVRERLRLVEVSRGGGLLEYRVKLLMAHPGIFTHKTMIGDWRAGNFVNNMKTRYKKAHGKTVKGKMSPMTPEQDALLSQWKPWTEWKESYHNPLSELQDRVKLLVAHVGIFDWKTMIGEWRAGMFVNNMKTRYKKAHDKTVKCSYPSITPEEDAIMSQWVPWTKWKESYHNPLLQLRNRVKLLMAHPGVVTNKTMIGEWRAGNFVNNTKARYKKVHNKVVKSRDSLMTPEEDAIMSQWKPWTEWKANWHKQREKQHVKRSAESITVDPPAKRQKTS